MWTVRRVPFLDDSFIEILEVIELLLEGRKVKRGSS